MEAVIALALAAALIALAARLQRRSSDGWSRRLAEIAVDYDGLAPSGSRGDPRLEGVVDGVSVHVDAYLALPGKLASVTTRVRVDTALPPSLTLRREGVGAAIGKLAGGDDLEIGDPTFDAAFRVRAGDPAAAVAHLDAAARRALLTLVGEQQASLEAGRVTLVHAGYASAEVLGAMIDAALAAGRALRSSGSVAERLERMALGDPLGSVRLRAFDLLVRELPEGDARRFATRALASDDPAVAARATTFLRGDGDVSGRLSVAELGDGRLSVTHEEGAGLAAAAPADVSRAAVAAEEHA